VRPRFREAVIGNLIALDAERVLHDLGGTITVVAPGEGVLLLRGLLSSIVSRPPFVAGQHPATAVAERNLSVRVLGYQGPVQPKSNVEALLFRR
jgi:hypothetical protein